MQFEMIQVPSEGNDNPIDKVIFYKKPKEKNLPPAVLEPKEVKQMVSNIMDIGYIYQSCPRGIPTQTWIPWSTMCKSQPCMYNVMHAHACIII